MLKSNRNELYQRVVRNLFTLTTIYYALRMLYRSANDVSTEFLQQKCELKMLLLKAESKLSLV